MQVSALNLIIAAQQARVGGPTPRSNDNPAAASPNISAASVPDAPRETDAFAPMAFKPTSSAAPAAQSAANPFAAPMAVGSQLDIRV